MVKEMHASIDSCHMIPSCHEVIDQTHEEYKKSVRKGLLYAGTVALGLGILGHAFAGDYFGTKDRANLARGAGGAAIVIYGVGKLKEQVEERAASLKSLHGFHGIIVIPPAPDESVPRYHSLPGLH